MSAVTRLQNIRSAIQQAGIDILALIPGPNLRYLMSSEHYKMERPIVLFIPAAGDLIAVIPTLEVPLFSRHPLPSQQVVWSDAEGYESAFKTAFAQMQTTGKTIGVEGLHMRFFEGEIIRQHAGAAQVIAADDVLAELRIRKDADELAALRKAIQISEQALEETLEQVRVGMSEIELADILEQRMKALGAEGLSFKTILHTGGNSALPHSGPLPDRIQEGDPLLIDFGAVYRGYHADITRVVFVGEPSAEQRAFYDVVRRANEAARAAARPGVTAESVDQAARQVIVEAGYEHLLRHRTGHGIGLEAHEPPYIVLGNERPLQPGMTFTVEPGIYALGEIGVRLEDDVLITEDGAESLTTFGRELRVLPVK